MLAGLSSMVREWRPDLVVADAAEFAGQIVAAERCTGPASPVRPSPLSMGVGDRWLDRLETRPAGAGGEAAERRAGRVRAL